MTATISVLVALPVATSRQRIRTTICSIDTPRLLARLCGDSPAIPETVWRQYLPDIPYDPPCA
ncbi:hypothetical protein [Lentzea sp.]|uniref:hypothetical protein n=1 Tax=Lentzea sp. TaxID=56099 RepID=UPI002C8BBF59|nr:hypothetical protein [Lentzea sp.]HUQ56630.1 hypothetical protein [Lentzea sp.]